MAQRDLVNNIKAEITLAPAARTASANGSSIDIGEFRSAAIVAIPGTITDGTHTLTVQSSPDNSTWAAVDSAYLQGSFANLASNTVQEVGYIGPDRYVRVNVAVTGATSGGTYAVSVIKGHANKSSLA